MSNRGDFVGTGPTSGNYIPAPTPSEQEDLPVYVNDELLRLGGVVNGVLEGGALPPHSELPKRVKEGMIMNFSQEVSEEVDSAGVWLYKLNKWWKLIDDPSSIILPQTIYKLTEDDIAPSVPAPSTLPPDGWVSIVPVKTDKAQYVWVCMDTDYDKKTEIFTWSQPSIFSAGVTDGGEGSNGSPGSGFYTGEFPTVDWTEPTATDRFMGLVGRAPVEHDIFIQNATSSEDSEGREFLNGVWDEAGLYIDGSIIASGTIAGNRFQAGSVIKAGNGNVSASLDGAHPLYRIYAGAGDPDYAPFRVDQYGNFYAESGVFGGTIYANSIEGDITDIITKKVAALEIMIPDGNLTTNYSTLFTISVSEAQSFNRVLKVDPMAFKFEGSPANRKIYNHLVVYQTEVNSLGVPIGSETQVVFLNEFSWPMYDEDEFFTSSPTLAVTVAASKMYKYRVAIAYDEANDGGEMTEQVITASIFKEGTSISFE